MIIMNGFKKKLYIYNKNCFNFNIMIFFYQDILSCKCKIFRKDIGAKIDLESSVVSIIFDKILNHLYVNFQYFLYVTIEKVNYFKYRLIFNHYQNLKYGNNYIQKIEKYKIDVIMVFTKSALKKFI